MITDYARRSQALTAVAAALAEHGHRAQAAEVVVRAVATAQARYEAGPSPAQLLAIAGTLAEVGETERAVQLVRRAEGIARSLIKPDDYCRALADVAEGFAGAGESERAITIACSLAGTYFHDVAMAAIAKSMAKAGNHVGVKRIMRLITEPNRQRDASASYAAALVQADRPDKALRHVERTPEDITHLVVLAAALAEAGHHVHTKAAVDRILWAWTHHNHYHGMPEYAATAIPPVMTALAAIGEHQRANEMVCLINANLEENERRDVVATLTGRGEPRQLIGVDMSFSMALWDTALAAMTRTLTDTTGSEGALEKVSTLEPAFLRGRAALALARTFRECGDDRNARECAARALGMVNWAEKLGELSFVSSDVALAMLEESALLAQ